MFSAINKRLFLKILVSILVLSFSLTTLVFAQDLDSSNNDSNNTATSTEKRHQRGRSINPFNLPTRIKEDFQERKDEKQEELQEKKEERKAELTEKKEERKEKLSEKRKDRVRAYSEKIIHRYKAAIERLEKLSERIDSRMTKLEERGLDLSEERVLLDVALVAINDASLSIEEAVSLIEEALDSDDPKEAFREIKVILAEAKKDLKYAHQKLVEVIISIKTSLPEDSEDRSGDDE